MLFAIYCLDINKRIHVICSIEAVEGLMIVTKKRLRYALTIATPVFILVTLVHFQLPTVLFVRPTTITIEAVDFAITDLSPVQA